MSCDGIQALNPLCQAAQVIANQTAGVVDSAFSHIAGYFGLAASNAADWLWQEIDTATTLDLHSPALLREMGATAAVAAVLCVGLFLVQVIGSVLRGQPGGLGRAATGLVVSFVGSAIALGTVRVLLGAVDALSAGFVEYTTGTNIAGLAGKLAFVGLNSISNPAVTLIFAVVILCAVVVVWAAMMIRKLMLLIAAVLAPLAFAGATADYTRAWVRRWIEFVAAMIVSKLLLVIILSIGVSVLNGAGQAGPAPTQGATQLAAGALILLMGGFAPWVAIRMFSFAGDTLYAAHASAGHAASGARAVASTPQKVATMQWHARTLIPSGRGGTGAPPARVSPAVYGSPRPPTWWGAGAGSTGRATAGAAGTGGGAAAATAAAAPAIAALAAGQVVKGVVNKGIGAATAAHDTAQGAGREPGPVERTDPPPSTRRPPQAALTRRRPEGTH